MQVTCNKSGAYRVQQALCYVVRKGSSAVESDRFKIAFTALFHWLKPLTDEIGEETGAPGKKTPTTSCRKRHILK